jgi:hypothetical protein
MSRISASCSLLHVNSNLTARAVFTYTAPESTFTSNVLAITTSEESVSYGDVASPRCVLIQNTAGSADLLIGTSTGTYPFRLAANEGQLLRLNNEGISEIQTVQTDPDVNGSLAAKYFDFYDLIGPVRVWMNISAGIPEISQIVVNTATGINGKYFDVYDSSGPARVWVDVNNTGTPPSTPGGGRLLEVNVGAAPTVADITNAIQAAIDADSEFAATDDNINTVTVVCASSGTRTNISEPDSATYFTVSVTQQGTASTTAPSAPGGGRLVAAVFAFNDTANTIASSISAAFAADAYITGSVLADLVTLTDKFTGTRTNIADTGSTGFTLTTTQSGGANPTIYLKSTGVSYATVSIAP